MNGGGCDRCLACAMQGARTPFQESNNRIVRAAAPIDPSPWPFAQPMFCYPTRNVSYVCFVLYALYVSTFAAASGGRITRSACVARSALSTHAASAVASESATGVLRVLQSLISQQSYFLMPPKFQPPLYDHRLPREDCAADIQYGIWPGESRLIGYSEDEVWDHIMAPIENLQCQALRDHRRPEVPLVPRYNAFLILLGMVRPIGGWGLGPHGAIIQSLCGQHADASPILFDATVATYRCGLATRRLQSPMGVGVVPGGWGLRR